MPIETECATLGLKTEKLVVHQEQPLNAEPRLDELIQHRVTPEELVYARNHCKFFSSYKDYIFAGRL